MSRTLRILFAVAFCLLLVSGVGCSRNRTRTRVSGSVLTANNQPVKAGRITFTPVNGGKTYTDTISGGRFSLRSRYRMPAGDYTVTIRYASRPQGGSGPDRTHTERVTLVGFGKDAYTFWVK